VAIADPVQLAVHVCGILNQLGIRSVVGGSIASSILGEPRTTLDADLVVDLNESEVDAVVRMLQPDFYIPESLLREAVLARSSVNIIHRETALKVDLFFVGSEPVARAQIERCIRVPIGRDPDEVLYITSAEDSVLQKLIWYRKTGEASDRQWRDVLGVLKVQADRLDHAYLRSAAERADVTRLLDRALAEAGLG